MARALAIFALATGVALLAPVNSYAVPGPDSTAILANLADPDSIALAEAYRSARSIPRVQVCALDLPLTADLSLDDYRALVEAPFELCLTSAGVLERIEAVVIARGVPLRVAVPTRDGPANVSLAAALSLWKSAAMDGTPLLGLPPGFFANCGGTRCLAAAWPNQFRSGTFEAGWSAVDFRGNTHRPLLVTMLHGHSYADAALLFTSALDAETSTASHGTFLFMTGADAARGALDSSYPAVMTGLGERGFREVELVAFDPALTGRTIASFFTGTAGLGETIEGNTFVPGAIADNLTSYGAVPDNFDPAAPEVQVSIARWVAKGVAGVHGTVDEPLNNVFPDRKLLLDYVDGGTLAEAFFRQMPFVYWRNLVLGDAMAAPYAHRPRVIIDGVRNDVSVSGARRLIVSASDPDGRAIESLRVFIDGQLTFEEIGGDAIIDECAIFPGTGETQILAVAQIADGAMKPKGWASITVDSAPGSMECVEEIPDSGPAAEDAAPADDATVPGADAAPSPEPAESSGCSCAHTGSRYMTSGG